MNFPADLVAHALARLPHQYRGDDEGETNTQKAIRALLTPAAALRQAMLDVIAQRDVNTAIGVWLDDIGKLVGRPRTGVTDTDDEVYRRYVKAQIAANKSDGLIEDLLAVAEFVVNDAGADLVFQNEGAAAYTLSVESVAITDAVAAVLIELLIKATAGGVRAILAYASDAGTVGAWGSGTWGTSTWARAVDEEI